MISLDDYVRVKMEPIRTTFRSSNVGAFVLSVRDVISYLEGDLAGEDRRSSHDIQRFVVDHHGEIAILDQLMHRQERIVGLIAVSASFEQLHQRPTSTTVSETWQELLTICRFAGKQCLP